MIIQAAILVVLVVFTAWDAGDRGSSS